MTKYILNGGCSYFHKSIETIRDILEYSELDTRVINIESSAGSNKYISESIILSVDSLISSGVGVEDLIVITDFTQVGRFSPIVPNEIAKQIQNNIKPTQVRKIFNLSYTFYNSFVEINNRMYSLMIDDSELSVSGKEWYQEQESYIINQKRVENDFEEYLKDIVTLQYFLKSKNIKHMFFLMNNVFDGWYSDFSHVYTKSKKWKLPSTKNTLHISNISDLTKSFWNMIDLDSFVFYETENNKYGGIDEYFVDKIGDVKFLQDVDEYPEYFYGNHPNRDVYREFTKNVMKSKLEKWKQVIS